MELDLQMQKISCYQAKKAMIEVYEESSENIIPDYCPDIARVVDAAACVFVRKYERVDDRIIVHGTTKVNLLYMAEGGAGLKSFEFSLPLENTLDLHLEEQCSVFSITAAISALEVRPLNPRKLLTRAAITFTINAFSPQEYALCTSIPTRQKYGIEVLKEQKSLSYIKSICEKSKCCTNEYTACSTFF